MELVGVSDIISDYRIKVAVRLDIPLYASLPEKASEMKDAGLPVAGGLKDLLDQVEVMVDCTPKGWRGEAANKSIVQQALYKRARLNNAATQGKYTAAMENE